MSAEHLCTRHCFRSRTECQHTKCHPIQRRRYHPHFTTAESAARRAHGDYPAPHVNRKQRLFGSHVLDPPLAVHGFPWAGQGRSYFMLLGQEWVTRRGALLQPEEERDSSCSLLQAAQPDLTLPSPCGFSGPWEVPLLPALEATKELQHSKAL